MDRNTAGLMNLNDAGTQWFDTELSEVKQNKWKWNIFSGQFQESVNETQVDGNVLVFVIN